MDLCRSVIIRAKLKKGHFMKINVLFSSLLFTLLFYTGCISKTIQTTSTPVVYEAPVPQPISVPTPQYTQPVVMVESSRTTAISVNEASTYHQLQTIQGPKVTIGELPTGFTFPEYKGKIVLLQFFGKECPYCFEEMPIINRLRSKYAQNMQVIAIQAQNPMSKATATNLINRFNMNYPIIEKSEASNLILFLRQTYGWTGILPYMLLIKDGVTEFSFKGKVSEQELEESIQMIL